VLPFDLMSAFRRSALACLSLAALLVWTRPSPACSLAFDRLVTPQSCGSLPEGALVFSRDAPVSTSAETGPWIEDRVFSSLLERSRSELRVSETPPSAPALRAWRRPGPGTVRTTSDLAIDARCDVEIGEAPKPAMPAPFGEVAARVVYTEGGAGGGGCSCPEVDSMTLRLETPPPASRRYVVAWFAPDASGALVDREPDALFATSTASFSGNREEFDRTFEITLGVADDHERTGAGFGRKGRYCFSLAWANPLGEIGQRSPPTCLDTADPADPSVNVDEKAACVCTFAGRRALSSGALTFFVLGAAVTLARRLLRRR